MRSILAPVALALPFLAAAAAPLPTADEVLAAMGKADESLRDYTMTQVKQDWSNGTPGPEAAFAVRWARPNSFHLTVVSERSRGQQVLWRQGWNDERLKVRLGFFPYLRINIDPEGDTALKDTWHPVPETSIPKFIELVLANAALGKEKGDLEARVVREEDYDGRPCVVLEMAAASNPVTDYVIASGETLFDVAKRFHTAAAPILHWNRGLGWKHPSDLGPGRRVAVPRYYASRIEIWVDRERGLPLKALLYDAEGRMFERFEHRGLKANVGLTEKDFEFD